jgi:large subunit ribosomal protein L12
MEMEYVYAAMLLHSAGKSVDEAGVTNVLKSAGIGADAARVKALVTALEGKDIKAIISQPVAFGAAPAAAGAPAAGKKDDKKKEEKKEEKKQVSDEEAAAGLGALFG